jgi:ankyrin repeat protein
MDAIELLVNKGAEINVTNQFGLNMVHVATQGDQAAALYFFKRLKCNLNQQDARGSTPLHWACYSHSEVALSYLLSFSVALNH